MSNIYTYNKQGQNIYFCRESNEYGHPYDPEDALTAWTILAADYPHWRKLDYIVDTFDPVLPLIEKLKQFDVSDSKHASAIASGNIKPVEFSINMDAQGMEFLALAIGSPAFSSHGRKIVQHLTFTTACPTQGDYFLIDIINGSDVVEHYALWSDTANDDTAGKPVIPGINASRVLSVDTSGPPADTTALAVVVKAELEGITGITTAANTANVIAVVVDNEGAVQPARDSIAAFDVTSAVTTYGSTTYTIAEDLTSDLPSFTIHLEQVNKTTAESIIWDLFGCVVESVAINVAFSDSIVKYSVTIKCPYALENSNGVATNPPPKKVIDSMSSMSALQESAAAYVIQEGTTDRTPQTVEKVSLDIKNNISFHPDIAARYMKKACAGRRDVTMNMVGLTQEKELFNYWQGAYTEDNGDYYPTGADRLNTVFKLQRDGTYDYISIAIYSWLLNEHNFSFVNVEDAVKKVDMTFVDGVGDSNGRILTSNTIVSLVDRSVMIEVATT